MSKVFKVFIILGICLTLLGGGVFTVAFAASGWDFAKISNVEYRSESYAENVALIDEIQVITKDEDVRIEECDGTDIKVDYYTAINKRGKVNIKFELSTENRVLTVKQVSDKFNFAFFNFVDSPDVVIKIPSSLNALALKLVTDTGDIAFKCNPALNFSSIDIKTDTGDVNFCKQLNCNGNLKIQVNTGDIFIKDSVICGGDVAVELDTGDVKINNNLTCNKLKIETDTGDVYTKNGAYISTSSGITIKTDTGDVLLRVLGVKTDFSFCFTTSKGSTNIEENLPGVKPITVTTNTGDARLYFVS